MCGRCRATNVALGLQLSAVSYQLNRGDPQGKRHAGLQKSRGLAEGTHTRAGRLSVDREAFHDRRCLAYLARFGVRRRRFPPISPRVADGPSQSLAGLCKSHLARLANWEYQLLLARDLGYVTPDSYQSACANAIEVKRMLSSLIKRIQSGLAITAIAKGAHNSSPNVMNRRVLADS